MPREDPSSAVDQYSSFVKRVAVAVVLGIAYAWWATNVAPFTSLAYTLIAIPSLTMVGLSTSTGLFSRDQANLRSYYLGRTRRVSLSSVAPWWGVLICAVTLETVGLALGGHSRSVPTLSTTADRLLEQHWERAALYAVWLLVGALPLWRLWHRHLELRT